MAKLQPLYDLQHEINRLYIAGSKFAKEDPRLLKYVPVFEKLGEKVPVFAKLASDIKDLAQTTTADSSIKLMNISTLLYSVLYTQGETFSDDWKLSPNEPLLNWQDLKTQYSYLEIKPAIEALTIVGSGRGDVLRDAFERKIFNDFRTFEYLDNVLQDKNHDVVQYVAETIIPSVGKIMVPYLKKNFKLEDNSVNARRLKLLIQLDEDLTETVDQIIGGKYPKLQIEAIIYLAKDPKNEPLIYELTKDKNKSVRESALKACALLGTKTALNHLKDLFINLKTKTTAVLVQIIDAIALVPMKEQEQELLDYLTERLNIILKETDLNNLRKILEEFSEEVYIINKKSYHIFETFFSMIVTNQELKLIYKIDKKWYDQKFPSAADIDKNKLHYSVEKVYRILENILKNHNKKQLQTIYETYFDHLTDDMKSNYFSNAEEFEYSKEKIFDTFSNLYPNTVSDRQLFWHCNGKDSYYNFSKPDTTLLDPRWYPLILKKINNVSDEKMYLVETLVPKDDATFNTLILNRLKNKFDINYVECILTRDIKDKYEFILNCLMSYTSYQYVSEDRQKVFKKFPKEVAPKMREVVAHRANKKMYYTFEFLLDIADALENVKKTTTE